MNWLVRLMDRAAVLLALVGTLGLVAMMLHISLDIILRSTMSVSIPATLEIGRASCRERV